MIKDLAARVRPECTVTQRDWARLYRHLGFVTPRDYEQIVDTYGAGEFDEFLLVLDPQNDNQYLDLKSQVNVRRQALLGLTSEVIPYSIESLTACAYTNNGDVIYWITDRSVNPDDWTVTINAARDNEWDEFDGTLLDLLVGLFTRTHVSPFFPEDFPSPAGVTFRRFA
ncbi:hypothetical protein SBI67_28530 [Mycolicibacterium sp. 120266]|uniref:hypothetical protein n=1 Tax=Mycolicibacterium sp. 120266 TaxID=3090601 RepID=UPI00299D12AF|nr:hypothetical protein [Mycolicibacterium sp. 120266]MDX1876085.1 hypothetical protein [Mycolicibacterium sp. 120266]